MKVIMRASISGTRDGADWPPKGAVIDLPDAEAVDMLGAGLASPAGEAVETATVPDKAETATKPRRSRKAS